MRNESFVKVLRNFFGSKHMLDVKLHRIPHNHPKPLKEPSMETIRSKSFKGFHGVKCKQNLNIKREAAKLRASESNSRLPQIGIVVGSRGQ